MKLCDYKEHEIDISNGGTFSAAGIDKNFDTLEKLKAEIDKESKIKYKPLKGFVIGGRYSFGNDMTICEVTITRPNGHSRNKSFWITHADKKRETRTGVYLDTQHNREIASEAISKRKQAASLNKEANALLDSIRTEITLEQIGGEK